MITIACPYPGLRPFTSDESHIFFGREEQTDDLLQRLGQTRFLAVVGPSGCGKSSLVRAGMIAALETGFMQPAGARWLFTQMRPGSRPMYRLAAALIDQARLVPEGVDRSHALGLLTATLLRGPLGLVEALRQTQLPADANLLILVDQFEEIFRYWREGASDEADAFVALLLRTAEQRELPVYVVITMRSDFFGHCAVFTGLPEALNESQYLTPRLTREQREAAIVGPAGVYGGEVEPQLVNRLLNEMGKDLDQLPLLQHLLMRMWTWRDTEALKCEEVAAPGGAQAAEGGASGARTLTLADYETVGGLAHALSNHANEAFDELSAPQKKIAEIMFRRLSDRDVRRPTPVHEIASLAGVNTDDVIGVVDVFREPGRSFVVPACPEPIGPDRVLDISHESLIRQWDKLKEWVEGESQSADKYRRLEQTARLWHQGRAALWGGPDLENALDWRNEQHPNEAWAKRYGDDFALAMKFLDASAAAAQAKAAEAEAKAAEAKAKEDAEREAELKRMRRARQIAAVLIVFALIALTSTGFAWWQRVEAQRNAEDAQQNESRRLAGLAENLVERRSPETAVRLALAALPMRLDSTDLTYAREAEGALLYSVQHLREQQIFRHEKEVRSVAFSPDGETLATGSFDKTVRLWDVATGEEKVLGRHENTVSSVAFSPDGETLATGSFDKTVRLWEVKTGKEIEVLKDHQKAVSSVAFSPDGETLATGSEDNTVRLWEVKTGTEIRVLGHESKVGSVAFSPDGKTLATGSLDNSVRLWEVKTGTEIEVLKDHQNAVWSVAFSPDGKTLATGSKDSTVRLWDLEVGRQIDVLHGHASAVYSVAFSPDGETLATGSEDNTVRLWDLEARRQIDVLHGHKNRLWSVSFSPDGRTLATASKDKTVRLWEVKAGKEIGVLEGQQKKGSSVAFSPDGKTLATGSEDSTVRLWEVKTGKEKGVLEGHQKKVSSVAFSPDGETLATGSLDKTVRLWEVKTGKNIGELQGRASEVLCVAFSPDGQMLATGSDNTVQLWEVKTGKSIDELGGHASEVLSVAFSPDGQTLATGSADTVRLWEVKTGKKIGELQGDASEVLSVAFSPDGRTLATGSEDSTVRLWDVATGKAVGVLSGDERAVWSLAFSSDGRTLATGSSDMKVRLWEVKTGKKISELGGHEREVSSVSFSPDGQTLATGSGDAARLWPLGQRLVDLACARVHFLPLSKDDKQRFGITKEWCTCDVSAKLRAELSPEEPKQVSSCGQ